MSGYYRVRWKLEPKRQTAYNIKRKAVGRQVGEDGDLERVGTMLEEMKTGNELVDDRAIQNVSNDARYNTYRICFAATTPN